MSVGRGKEGLRRCGQVATRRAMETAKRALTNWVFGAKKDLMLRAGAWDGESRGQQEPDEMDAGGSKWWL